MKRTYVIALLLVFALCMSGDAKALADSSAYDLSSVQNSAAPVYSMAAPFAPAPTPTPAPAQAANQVQGVLPQESGLVSNSGSRAANLLLPSSRMPLPVVSTGSVDLNICDMPFIRSNGGNGAFGGAGGTGTTDGSSNGGSSGSQAPPNLPPGWAGVMCHGVYAGAIPPGGNIVDFWNGAYGFAGDAQQQAALLQEGQWLKDNGQLDGM